MACWRAIQPWLTIVPTQQLRQFAQHGQIEDILDHLQYGDVKDPNAPDEFNMTPYQWAKIGEWMGSQNDNVVYLFECLHQYSRSDVIHMFRSYLNPYTSM